MTLISMPKIVFLLGLVAISALSCSHSRHTRNNYPALGQTRVQRSPLPDGLGHRTLAKLAALDLSSDQRRQIKTIQSRLKRSHLEKRSTIQRLELELEEQMGQSPISLGTVRSLLDRKSLLSVEMEMAKASAISEIVPILTTEQREKFSDPSWAPCALVQKPPSERSRRSRSGGGRQGGGYGPPGRW